ncbi:uncharacterized protein LOC108740542 [Agrilus planipennis]|uniref:Uncharacterized protein LOC108740542 n=1 Tax=Agrilus planipennis TaxID=224129 RepID=A0A1W4X2Q1_AGRPL|nr:uncharacterized protein LOC108740542 [Agrilus planipennis]XP_025837420.1 uncharacterized protein LOC108740542 [Agrilus planipennis]
MAPSVGLLAAFIIVFVASNLNAQINDGAISKTTTTHKNNMKTPFFDDKNSSEQNNDGIDILNNSGKKTWTHVKKDLNENHKRESKRVVKGSPAGGVLLESQERTVTKHPVKLSRQQKVKTNLNQNNRLGSKRIKRSPTDGFQGIHEGFSTKHPVELSREKKGKKELNKNHKLRPKRILKRSPVDTFQETKLFLQEGSSSTKHSVELSEEKNEDKDDREDATSYRLTRSASQEQWVKQPYPVQKVNEEEDTESSDNIRAPKVHFVTQKRTDNGNGFGNVDRELERERSFPRGRSRSFLSDRTLPEYRFRESIPEHDNHGAFARERSFDKRGFFDRIKEPYRPMREKFYDFRPYEHDYPPRRSFNYPPENGFSNSYTSFPPRKRYGRRYETYRQYDFERNNMDKPKKQTRIIYYATLPEVARSPPKVNLRDRFNYNYDGYLDDPYFGPGRFREPYVPPPQFFENDSKRMKPSTSATTFSKDVAVKEPKKVPESRIYSEAERRYGDDYERFPMKNT